MTIHRRIDLTGGFTDDDDWAQLHTLPSFTPGTALDAGGVVEVYPPGAKLSITMELRDGMGDAAGVVATPAGATVVARTVTYMGRDGGVYRQSPEKIASLQTNYIDEELPKNQPSWIRLHTGVNLPATGALWVDVSVEVVP